MRNIGSRKCVQHRKNSSNKKILYGIIHQVELLVNILSANLEVVHDPPLKDKLNTLGQLKSSVITIQLLFQYKKSTHNRLIQVSAPVIIQVDTIEDPPQGILA